MMTKFNKDDAGKLRYDLIPPEVLEELAKVFTFGANKYSSENWKLCDDDDRYIGALFRHLQAHRQGELFDEESGMLHLSHLLTNAAFLVYSAKQEIKK